MEQTTESILLSNPCGDGLRFDLFKNDVCMDWHRHPLIHHHQLPPLNQLIFHKNLNEIQAGWGKFAPCNLNTRLADVGIKLKD